MKLLYISIFAFVFIAVSSLAFNSLIKSASTGESQVIVLDKRYENVSLPEIPVINNDATFPIISAQSAIVIEIDSGVNLYEKNPDSPFLPASTTKMTTALVALEHYPLNQIIKVTGVNVEGQKMRLVENEEISVENLLYGLLVFSANDAAEVLASNYPGGRVAFIAAMNAKARELNLDNTIFMNPSGLDVQQQVTSSRDLARIAAHSMENETFKAFVGTKTKVVKSADGKIVHNLKNINSLLGEIDGVLGVKTGWTENARENLVTYVERDGRKILIVVLGSQDRFGETRELIDWVFESYSWNQVKPS